VSAGDNVSDRAAGGDVGDEYDDEEDSNRCWRSSRSSRGFCGTWAGTEVGVGDKGGLFPPPPPPLEVPLAEFDEFEAAAEELEEEFLEKLNLENEKRSIVTCDLALIQRRVFLDFSPSPQHTVQASNANSK